jgi:HSP20 family protein
MALMKFDPMRGFDTLARRMSDVAGNLEKGINFEYGAFAPRVDISEDDKHLYLNAEIPGVNKDNVKVSVKDDNVLTIKGEKKAEVKEEDEDKSYIRLERSYGEFTRSFQLPENVDSDSVEAKFEDGVLNITLDKKEPEKPKEKEIKIL